MREAIERLDGHEIDTQGDAFFVAFARARDAVAAAVELAAGARLRARWPDGVSVRVRVGLHTGEPLGRRRPATSGSACHPRRAHRRGRARRPGAPVETTTRELVDGRAARRRLAVVDLGEHALKGLPRPERIFQLEIADLPGEFPAADGGGPGVRGARGRARTRRSSGRLAAAPLAAGARGHGGRRGGRGRRSRCAARARRCIARGRSAELGRRTQPLRLGCVGRSGRDRTGRARRGSRRVVGREPCRSVGDPASTRRRGKRSARFRFGSTPVGLATTKNALWVTGGNGEVSTFDATYSTPVGKPFSPASLDSPVGTSYESATAQPTLSGFGSIWVVNPAGYVSRIDPASHRVMGSATVGNDPSAIAAGAGWSGSRTARTGR